MIDSDDIYKYLGFIVVVVLVCVFVSKCMRMHFSIIEGMTSGSKDSSEESTNSSSVSTLAQEVLEKGQEIEDNLLIEKYKDDYEDLIINTDTMVSMSQLGMLKQLSNNVDVKKTDELIKKINDIETFKTSLNSMMKSLDKKSSSESGGLF
tara:strand:+ start:1402 stop:1851 length:450 start_codon:yes stop_codon:yes gene_type:complete